MEQHSKQLKSIPFDYTYWLRDVDVFVGDSTKNILKDASEKEFFLHSSSCILQKIGFIPAKNAATFELDIAQYEIPTPLPS